MQLRVAQDQEQAVRERYADAAQVRVEELCCPVSYQGDYLEIIPREIVERDYGCGDPTPYVRPGETVLDLGSGSGKVCYVLSQIVGPQGRVIGVDCNQEMLALARKYREEVANQLGYANVEFRCGMIQDLQLDLDQLAAELTIQPVVDQEGWLGLRNVEERFRRESPLVQGGSIDCVVSNCVINLVRPDDRAQLFQEVYRVLRPGGRVAISDIVAEKDVPPAMREDPTLWSGCISGAYREDQFLQAFEDAGFHGIKLVNRQTEPWRVVEGIEFRSVTVMAFKGKQDASLDRSQVLFYRGPFKTVSDDNGHSFRRGQRTAVSDETYRLLRSEPYEGMFEPVSPSEPAPTDICCEDGKCC